MSQARPQVKAIHAALLRRWPLPPLPPHADKTTRGDVLVVGGSRDTPGAVLLAGEAALRSGAGRVRLATVRSAASALAVAFPEARVVGLPETRQGALKATAARALAPLLAESDAGLLGPGMFEAAAATSIFRQAVRSGQRATVILDAAALKVLEGRKRVELGSLNGVIATPHAGEMAELWDLDIDQVRDNPLQLAMEAAQCLGVTLVLKGNRTFVVDPDGVAFLNTAGNPGLATAGSGDSLAGIIAGVAARGASPVQAAVWGVYLHARAGERLARRQGPLGYLARELSAQVPELLGDLSSRR
jgi:ADP-dependent NAD(P)H-hydrate dehydratase